MDPISLIGLAAGLIPMCAKVGKSLNDARSKYVASSMTVSAIVSECTVIAAALSQLEQVARNDPQGLSLRLDPRDSQLGISFELALSGCSLTLTALNEEIDKLTGKESTRLLGWKS